MTHKNKRRTLRDSLLEGGEDKSNSDLGWYSRTHKKVRETHIPWLDKRRDCSKFIPVFTISFGATWLLYHLAGNGQSHAGQMVLVYCDTLNTTSTDLLVGENQKLANPVSKLIIAKQGDRYNVMNGTSSHDIVCIRSDDKRGLILKTNDTLLWELSQLSDAIVSVTHTNHIQPWFTPSHVGNHGDTSQKLSFFSNETNNYYFGNDSFDLTGNHNQLVDIRKEVATERGYKYVMINTTLLESDTDESFELTFADEPWIYKQFWKKWVLIVFSSLLVLSYLVPKGYIKRSKNLEEAKAGLLSKLQDKVTWVLEILDMYKDWVLLFMFPHARWAYLTLIFSIVFTFAFADMSGAGAGGTSAQHRTTAHNLLNYFGLTDGEKDNKQRATVVFVIAIFENIPQLMTVVGEVFNLKQSVTFVQLGNPLYGLFMTYKALGPMLGKLVKEGHILVNMFYPFIILPQVFVSILLTKHMVSYDKIPQIYFDEGLITKEDPDQVLISDNQVVLICAAISILSFAICYYQIKSFNIKQKRYELARKV